ncbi:MAG: sensor histidine kinase [Planctomycetota bacterium]|jgi:signal transduction histidine kinase
MQMGIRVKWIGALCILLLIMGGVLLLLLRWQMRRSLRDALASKGEALAHSLAHLVEEESLTRKEWQLEIALRDAVESDRDVLYVMVADPRGRVIADTFPRGVPKTLASWVQHFKENAHFDSDQGRIRHLVAPILEGEGGVLHMGLSEENVDREVGRAILRIGSILGGIFLVGILGVITLGAIQTRPGVHLAERAKRIADGELSLRLQSTSQDEVGHLARTIDSMRERITHSEKLAEVGEMTAWIAHEINNPLDGVREGIRILLEDPALAEEWLPHLDEGLERIEYVVKRLLAFSHKPNLQVQSTDPAGLVESALQEVASRIRDGEVSLEKQVEGPPFFGDQRALRQVLANLLGNSLDAMNGKGVIRIEYEPLIDRVLFRIRDNGCGMTPEQLKKVRDSFFTTKSAGHGTGLGLVVCRNLIEAHGGVLEMESEVGKSTTVTLHLPQI